MKFNSLIFYFEDTTLTRTFYVLLVVRYFSYTVFPYISDASKDLIDGITKAFISMSVVDIQVFLCLEKCYMLYESVSFMQFKRSIMIMLFLFRKEWRILNSIS